MGYVWFTRLTHYYDSTMAQKMADRTCSVCLEQFVEPKILPCCHTFCLKCLERTGKTKAEITCPLCRKTHAIPAGGLQNFLTDFVVSHEVEVAGLKSPSAKEAPVCGECEGEGPVESYCRDCQAYLCSECSNQAHKKFRSYRGHKVIPVQDLDAASLQSSKVHYCSVHSGEVMKLYCETCSKPICRDCTLVDHHQHKYKFAQDARKQINSQLMSLVRDGKQRLTAFKANLGEIQRVETTAANYPEVFKADINALFDRLAHSIEKRRQQLLTQAEGECQKDLKQIWADKDFHQTTISQFEAALGLASKACKCTSDVEMILTALQSIRQLSQLKEVKWDASAFTSTVSSPGVITEGIRMEANQAGCIKRVSFSDVMIQNLPATAELGQTITFKVMGTLLNGRSKQKVGLRSTAMTTEASVQVCVKYGHAQKPYEKVSISQDPTSDGGYIVTLRLVCGGKHTIAVELHGNPVKGSPFSLNVTGIPEAGARVRHGPDWKEQTQIPKRRVVRLREEQMMPNTDANEGTVQRAHVNQYHPTALATHPIATTAKSYNYVPPGSRLAPQPQYDDQYEQPTATVRVYWDSDHHHCGGYVCNHNWGGTYEIELV